MIFRPDIKPPMWGPPDAVQYAVRANAERLGISPKFMAPLWEGGGVATDYANGLSGTLAKVSSGNPTWKSGGVDFGWVSSTSYGYVDFQQDFTLPAGFTIAFDYVADTYRTYQGLITSGGFGHGWSIYQYALGPSESWRVILPGKTLTLDLPITPSGTRATIVVTQKSGSVRMYKNGVESSTGATTGITTTSVGDSPLRLGCRSDTNDAPEYGADCVILSALIADGFLAPDEYHATPYALLMPVSRPVYFDLGAGGGTYTETLDTLITSISSAADQQAYRDTVDTLITSGATVEAVIGMVEALLSLGVSASTAADVQGYAEGVSDTIISASDTAAAQDYVDSLVDTVVSASGVTDTTGAPPLAESLLTTAVSASNVSAAQAYVDTVTALAVSASSLGEVLGLVEQIGTVGESVSSLSDRQLYYDNVAIVALSSSSLAEVGAYIEQVAAAAVSVSSLDIRVLSTDEIMLPELLYAISRVCNTFEATSRVRTELLGVSKITLRRLN